MTHVEKHSGKLIITAEAEAEIKRLLALKNKTEQELSKLKLAIEMEASALDPDFKYLESDEYVCNYRQSGSKYEVDITQLKDKQFMEIEHITKYKPVNEAIDNYLEYNGELPSGISRSEGEKTLYINRRKVKAPTSSEQRDFFNKFK